LFRGTHLIIAAADMGLGTAVDGHL
jgi:hypothetical protein